MGLLKGALLLGGGAYVLNRVTQSHADTRHCSRAARDTPLPGHAPYCNGACGGRCTPTRTDPYLHQSYCTGACASQCNPAHNSSEGLAAPAQSRDVRGPPAFDRSMSGGAEKSPAMLTPPTPAQQGQRGWMWEGERAPPGYKN